MILLRPVTHLNDWEKTKHLSLKAFHFLRSLCILSGLSAPIPVIYLVGFFKRL